MVNGLYDLHGEKSKAKAREKYGLAPGSKAGVDYINTVIKPGLVAQPTSPTNGTTAPTSDLSSILGFDVPKKFAGMPTWMWATGGAIMLMFFMKGSSGGRKR